MPPIGGILLGRVALVVFALAAARPAAGLPCAFRPYGTEAGLPVACAERAADAPLASPPRR